MRLPRTSRRGESWRPERCVGPCIRWRTLLDHRGHAPPPGRSGRRPWHNRVESRERLSRPSRRSASSRQWSLSWFLTDCPGNSVDVAVDSPQPTLRVDTLGSAVIVDGRENGDEPASGYSLPSSRSSSSRSSSHFERCVIPHHRPPDRRPTPCGRPRPKGTLSSRPLTSPSTSRTPVQFFGLVETLGW